MDKKNKKLNVEVFDYSTIPKFMQEHGRFCLWKLMMKPGKNKPDKIPYRINGKRADATNPQHYSSFEETVEAFAKGGYAGIGIGCFEPLRLVDVDDCVVDGKLEARGQDIVDTLDSYTELSPSGNGIHIFILADGFAYDSERYYINNRNTHVEVYAPDVTGKFLTLTGKAIHGADVNERSKQLQVILDKYMKRPDADVTAPTVDSPGSFLSDESVYTKASKSKQADKFNALWNGEIPEGKSPSEADMALAEILAFWCGGDTEQMDRLFRRSGLMRDKWDRVQSGSTYGMITLTKAVKKCTAFYSPMMPTADEDFNDILAMLTEFNLLENRRYRSGDIGYGRLFADMFKEIARYVPERKKWFVYDGKRWVPDIANLKIMELGKDLADAMLLYTSTIKDEEKRLLFLKESKYWQQRRFRETYIKEAQSVYPVSMERFDSNRYLFNCNNVTFDLRTGIPKEHSPEDFLTKISPVDYDPEARSERFDRFIDEVMSADRDKALFLQKALGYGICGDTRYECMFFLYGETTRNGKGTLMESVLRVLGDYGKAVRPETIAQKHSVNSQAPSEDIARLAGIRFANISEPSRGLVLNAAQVKNMTGNDTYAKDTSKKIRAVFKSKGEAGKPLCTNPPYGYVKDPEDKHHWIVEETAADVVRKIFNLCVEGYGPSQIAGILEKDKVLVPSAYYKSLGISYPAAVPDNPYAWQSRTVADLLSHQEYLGHTVNFKTYKKSYKSKKKLQNDPSKWQIFENTHEAIIDQETFDIVQRIRDGRRRRTPMGEMPILSGMLYCADCGAKLYQVRAKGWTHEQEHFVCATYRKVKGGCSSHQIHNVQVEEIFLRELHRITAYAREHESEFIALVTKQSEKDLNRQLRDSHKELEQAISRITKMDTIVQRLYEDNLDGKISDERFARMSATYDAEQKQLVQRQAELQEFINKSKEQTLNVDSFLKVVRKYTDITELTAEIIRSFVERIDVYKPEKVPGTRTKKQTICIHWNFIGAVDIPADHEKRHSLHCRKLCRLFQRLKIPN